MEERGVGGGAGSRGRRGNCGQHLRYEEITTYFSQHIFEVTMDFMMISKA